MTSSLVGSEMCIRDSGQPQGCFKDLHVRKCGRWLVVLSLQVVWMDRERAVSYTHLTLPTICSV
eukprot:8675952-Prorocentrum_lima.AAC.1